MNKLNMWACGWSCGMVVWDLSIGSYGWAVIMAGCAVINYMLSEDLL